MMPQPRLKDSFSEFSKALLQTGCGCFLSFHRNSIAPSQAFWGVGSPSNLKVPSVLDEMIGEGFWFNDWRGEKIYFTSDFFQKNLEMEEGLPERLLVDQVSFSGLQDLESCLETSLSTYQEKIKLIQAAQRKGEMWVMNLANRLSGKIEYAASLDDKARERALLEKVLSCFDRFLDSGRAHVGGVIWTDQLKAVSFSPEVFLFQSTPSVLKTFPIKGTGSRDYLENSEKEKSELAMVIDLLRNDLGMIADEVQMGRARYLTDEGNFYHAQSEIFAQIPSPFLSWSNLKKLLPPGSMTGCPKRRVLEYIQDLESFDRGFYSGLFGVRSGDTFLASLLIRTIFFEGDRWYYPVGAGITVESDGEKEASELLLKAKVLQSFL